mgnify:CR=1 FL=1
MSAVSTSWLTGGDASDAKRWGWDVVKVGMLVLGVIGLHLAALLFYRLVLGKKLVAPMSFSVVVEDCRT